MEGLTLADGRPTGAPVAPDFLSHPVSREQGVPEAAATPAFEEAHGSNIDGSVMPSGETVETSDPFDRILQKVGAPPALKKNNSRLQSGLTTQALKNIQLDQGIEAAVCLSSLEGSPKLPQATDAGETRSKDTATVKDGDKDHETSTDTTASPLEYDLATSSRLPEGVCAVGKGTLVEEEDLSFNEREMYEIARACQSTSDLAAAALTPSQAAVDDTANSSIVPPPCSNDPPFLEDQELDEEFAECITSSGPSEALQWPFESGLSPWEDIGHEIRKTAEGISGQQLEDHKKKRIWVVHRGACTPVSWYVDTSPEDVKISILCACDVLADEGEHLDGHGNGDSSFCLRQIRPLPESADVDCDDLFMGVRTLTLRCGLPPLDSNEGPSFSGAEIDGPRDARAENEGTQGDRAVSIRVVLGARIFSRDFASLTDGATYLLEPHLTGDDDPQHREELANLRKQTGDKWRRLSVAVDPLLHIEAQKAVLQMRKGANLLKHTRFGHPHLRQFQLSADRQRLLWYSANKGKEASVVQMRDLQGLVLGQKSATFAGYRIPALQHLSFSLVFREEGDSGDYSASVELPATSLEDTRTLDLTCKDEAEFDTWVAGCKAIIAANKGLKLSKMSLLSHSRRFLKALKRSDTTVQLTNLPEAKDRAALQDCMDLPWHPPEELERKYTEQRKRVNAVAEEMRTLDRKVVVRSNVDISVLVGAGPAYANVLSNSAEVDDEEMEFERMRELLKEVTGILDKAKAELDEYRASEGTYRRRFEEEGVAAVNRSFSTPLRSDASTECADDATRGASEASGSSASLENVDNSEILAISSGGQVLMKSGAPGLTFEERFKMASAKSVDLQAVQEQVKEGLTAFLQQAATQTVEAQQLLSSALAVAAAAVGVDSEQQNDPDETLPAEDIEKLKSINQLLWRAEVDVENIEDMLERLQPPSGFGGLALAGTVANLNQIVTEQVNKWGDQLTSMVTDLLRRAEIPGLVQQSDSPQGRPRLAYASSDSDDDFM